jgi:hypothetical protein
VHPEVPATADFCAIAGDPLARAVDGQSFRVATQAWTARVHSVYREDGSCWIQVFKDGDAAASVLVRCSRPRAGGTGGLGSGHGAFSQRAAGDGGGVATTRFLPARFASYSARSARSITLRASSPV